MTSTRTSPTADPATDRLLARFTEELRSVVQPVAVWAHGSVAAGTDYRPGRSDLDLIAVVERPCTRREERKLTAFHRGLETAGPLAERLHCSYVPAAELGDPRRSHPTWAHRELFRRPVTPVTRSELHRFGLVLAGRPVGELLPEVPERQLREYIVRDFKDYWLPHLDDEKLFHADVWVDFGMLTLARAVVTLRDGRLITKAEALGVLARLGAPAAVVADVRQRRYAAEPVRASDEWRARRAGLALEFLRPRVRRITAGTTAGQGRV
ncbi:nucleotidyltransferase [Streptomyces sp. NPDC094448]|uniref:nucleotidyltransferase domain-containing protein n=1 Tax=Streptomyces sp. NPDC094448 TaxID=3366063 RepID=UPI00382D3C2E